MTETLKETRGTIATSKPMCAACSAKGNSSVAVESMQWADEVLKGGGGTGRVIAIFRCHGQMQTIVLDRYELSPEANRVWFGYAFSGIQLTTKRAEKKRAEARAQGA